jgi:hypothetical protein
MLAPVANVPIVKAAAAIVMATFRIGMRSFQSVDLKITVQTLDLSGCIRWAIRTVPGQIPPV